MPNPPDRVSRSTRFSTLAVLALAGDVVAQECIGCHKMVTPGVVSDWQLSKHAENDFGCEVCHGE